MFKDQQDIDHALSGALNVHPSRDFDTRVLRRVQQDQRSRRLAAPAWCAAAAAVLIGVSAWVLTTNGDRPVAPPVVSTLHPVAAVPPQPRVERPEVPPTAADESVSPGPVSGPSVRATRPQPQVIVAANQLDLIRQFLRAVNTGRVAASESTAKEAEIEDLIVPPLTVHPIPVVSIEAGGTASGPKGLQ